MYKSRDPKVSRETPALNTGKPLYSVSSPFPYGQVEMDTLSLFGSYICITIGKSRDSPVPKETQVDQAD